MNHVVFGAGLIGGYLAGVFIAQGLPTSIVARPKIVNALKNGLKVTDFNNNQHTISEVSRHVAGKKIDVLWLTVKCTAVGACINDMRDIVQADTIIICCQNGLSSDQIVRNAFPKNTILRAVVGFNVAQESPSHLHRSTDGKLIVEHHPDIVEHVHRVNCEALPALSSHHIVANQWAKLQLNIANAVNALSDIPVKAMTEDAGFRRLIADLMSEILMVTDALGLNLPKVTAVPAKMIPKLMRLPNWLFKMIAQKMLAIDPNARASMWWDLSQGKPSEIEFLNGAVTHQANALGVACPLNSALVKLVRAVERGDQKIGFTATELQRALNHA